MLNASREPWRWINEWGGGAIHLTQKHLVLPSYKNTIRISRFHQHVLDNETRTVNGWVHEKRMFFHPSEEIFVSTFQTVRRGVCFYALTDLVHPYEKRLDYMRMYTASNKHSCDGFDQFFQI